MDSERTQSSCLDLGKASLSCLNDEILVSLDHRLLQQVHRQKVTAVLEVTQVNLELQNKV